MLGGYPEHCSAFSSILASTKDAWVDAPGPDSPEGLQTLPDFPPRKTVENYWPKLPHSDHLRPVPPSLGTGNQVESRDCDRTTGGGKTMGVVESRRAGAVHW